MGKRWDGVSGQVIERGIDRRSFVRKAGMAAAGTALSGSTLGCAADEIFSVVPCLPLAAVPAPVGKMTYLTASAIGCALDCDLSTGKNKHTGGAATDDAPVINAAMAGASASNPITLILDGSASISGLYLPAGGYWGIQGQGCTTGFVIKSGANSDGLHNGGPTAGNPADPGGSVPLPVRGSNVTLSNFQMNGNQGNGLTGDSTTGDPRGAAIYDVSINLMNLNNILIENVVVFDSPSYHFRFTNVGNVTVTGCVMRSSGNNTDGLHFDGPANDIMISGCDFTTGDDAIALNCPEGYSGGISRVTVTNCTFNSLSLMRLYADLVPNFAYPIEGVSVSGCTGSMTVAAFLVGTYASDKPNADVMLNVTNCQLSAPAILDISADFSSIAMTSVTLTPYHGFGGGYAFLRTTYLPSGTPYTGASLALTNCAITRNADVPVTGVVLSYGSTIETLELNGFTVQDPAGSGYATSPELLNIVAGSIPQLKLDAVTSTHLAAPVQAGGFGSIGVVSGAGVLASGWEFPDAVMANGVPYVSAGTGQGSIKVGGVVKPYP